MEMMILFAQSVATVLIAAWLTLGLRDNILHPAVNEIYTAEVMSMTRMARDYPEDFQRVAHRAISNRSFHLRVFRLIVAAQAIATFILWAGALALLVATLGVLEPTMARTLAMAGSLAFTTIWASFLIVGNHFCYWFCHEGAQNTHFQMTLWGLGTMILIAVG